jgi:hypothetical protein
MSRTPPKKSSESKINAPTAGPVPPCAPPVPCMSNGRKWKWNSISRSAVSANCVSPPARRGPWKCVRPISFFLNDGSPVAIAVIRGFDSLVSAYLIKQQGKTMFSASIFSPVMKNRPNRSEMLQSLVGQLDIPVHRHRSENTDSKPSVVDYFTAAYQLRQNPQSMPGVQPGDQIRCSAGQGPPAWAPAWPPVIMRVCEAGINGRYRLRRGIDEKGPILFSFPPYPGSVGQAVLPIGNVDQVKSGHWPSKMGCAGDPKGEPGCMLYP